MMRKGAYLYPRFRRPEKQKEEHTGRNEEQTTFAKLDSRKLSPHLKENIDENHNIDSSKLSPNSKENTNKKKTHAEKSQNTAVSKNNDSINCSHQEPNKNILYIGRLLGEGGFCQVYELSPNAPSSPFRASRANTKKIEVKFENMNMNGPLVVKSIKTDCDPSSPLLEEAIEDLRRETSILSTLHHPNIISSFGTFNSEEGSCKYVTGQSLLLERLDETLSKRISKWKKHLSSPKRGRHHKVFVDLEQKKEQHAMILERLSIARDVAAAMKYLHERNIIHRDLKPENIGFNMEGTVKLFDFGMSRKIPIKTSSSSQSIVSTKDNEIWRNDTYEMSGGTGTLRYMAPEVAFHEPYNSSVDVYSFSILLWEIWTLKVAFDNFDHLQNFVFLVAKKGLRPELQGMNEEDSHSMTAIVEDLMERGWSNQSEERPKFDEIYDLLEEALSA